MNTQTTMKTLTKKYRSHLEAAITIGELDPETDIQYLIGVLEAIQMPETSAAGADVHGNYRAAMSECFNVGMSGGCGPECYIYLEGRCSEPQEMLPRLDDQGILLHSDLYAGKITSPKQ